MRYNKKKISRLLLQNQREKSGKKPGNFALMTNKYIVINMV